MNLSSTEAHTHYSLTQNLVKTISQQKKVKKHFMETKIFTLEFIHASICIQFVISELNL